MPSTWPEQRVYIGRINHVGAGNLIKEILADEPITPFHFAVGRIMEMVQEENHALAFDETGTVRRVAWAGRNLMELRILVRFVCQSQANLERFNNDLLTTAASTMRAQLRLLNDLAKKVPDPMRASPDQYRDLANMQKARVEAGLGGESPLMARTCASKVGLEKEYLAFSGVTSALIHPSAISVLKTFDLESYRDGLTCQGLMLAGEVILGVRAHIGKYGFRPER